MTKLSELLEAGAYALGDVARDAGNFADGDSWRKSRDTLRTIAPALVDVIANVRYFHEATCPLAICPACRLFAAMKEAGVTCE